MLYVKILQHMRGLSKLVRDVVRNVMVQIWPMVVIISVILISFRITYLVVNHKKFYPYKEILLYGFVFYILCLFSVVTFKDVSWSANNFIPFKEILRYEITSEAFYRNIIGKMFMFMPLVFFAGYILKLQNVKPALLISFIVSISIELTQLFIGRVFDIDDIMLNVIGGTLGYFLYKIINYIQDHMPKIFQNVIIYNIVIIVLVIVLIMYLLKIINISGL